jgi:hypothetical protein
MGFEPYDRVKEENSEARTAAKACLVCLKGPSS